MSLKYLDVLEDANYLAGFNPVLGTTTVKEAKPESYYVYRGNRISASVQRNTDYWLKNNGVDVSGEWTRTKKQLVKEQTAFRRRLQLKQYVDQKEAFKAEAQAKAQRNKDLAAKEAAKQSMMRDVKMAYKQNAIRSMNICWEPITFTFDGEEYELKVPGVLRMNSLSNPRIFAVRD